MGWKGHNLHNRILHWDGCTNVRDLGGLRTVDGRRTRSGAIVRGDSPARLTTGGWDALYGYGIRTIITLRTHGMVEPELDFISPFSDLVTIQAPIEDVTDEEFLAKWAETGLWSTPLYYRDALQRWPGRHAAVISAVANAQPGGVLFHCIRGYDRTGIIALILLSLAGVVSDDLIADYALSLDPDRDEILARDNTSVSQVLLETLAGFDPDRYLLLAGVSPRELDSVRSRLLGKD